MRFLAVLSSLIIVYSCQQKSKENVHLEIVDTEMAELKKEPPLPLKDSVKYIKCWSRFYKSLLNNDTNKLICLSLKNVYSPLYTKNLNYYRDTKLAPIRSFLNELLLANYIATFSPDFKTEKPFIYGVELNEAEIFDLGFAKNDTINGFTIYFTTTQMSGNYKIWRDHHFRFIQVNDSFKFMGLNINENNSMYQYKLMPVDRLYFPLRNKEEQSFANLLDTGSNKYYSRYLSDMKEPIIFTYKGDDEIYRFTWLRSFNNPVAIRIEKCGNSYALYTKELLDYQGYIPQEIKVNTQEEITTEQWRHFKSMLDKFNFWNMASNDPEPAPNDGAEWILEGLKKNNYHFTHRHMVEDQNYRACCMYLLSLTKLDIPEKDRY